MTTDTTEPTLGPWSRGDRPEIANHVRGVDRVDGSPQTVCIVYGYTAGEVLANATLIAAARDLLAALDDILHYEGGADNALDDEYVMERAHAARDAARQHQEADNG